MPLPDGSAAQLSDGELNAVEDSASREFRHLMPLPLRVLAMIFCFCDLLLLSSLPSLSTRLKKNRSINEDKNISKGRHTLQYESVGQHCLTMKVINL